MGRMPCAPARRTGMWKIAYADFLTALMAFFLVLWLVTGVSQDEKEELAQYFTGPKAAAASTVFEASAQDRAEAGLGAALSALIADGRASMIREGDALRLEIMDRSSAPIFDNGASGFNETGAATMKTVAQALVSTGAAFSIEGHTDAFPALGSGRSNWEVSSERAQAARRLLVENGVSQARILGVTGRADTQPLRPTEPHLPANRRVSILIDLTNIR